MSLCHDQNLADDLVQTTFLRALNKQHTYKEIDNLKGWLYVILYNTFRDHLRRHKIRDTIDIEYIDVEAPEIEATEFSDLEMQYIQTMTKKEITIAKLLSAGLKFKEIAEMLDTSVGAIKTASSRSQKKAKEFLEKHEET